MAPVKKFDSSNLGLINCYVFLYDCSQGNGKAKPQWACPAAAQQPKDQDQGPGK